MTFHIDSISTNIVQIYLGWVESLGHVVQEEVEDEGLHIFLEMVVYYMKESGQENFEFVHHIVSTEDMNEGKLEYKKFRKVGLKQVCESLSYQHIANGTLMGLISYEKVFGG